MYEMDYVLPCLSHQWLLYDLESTSFLSWDLENQEVKTDASEGPGQNGLSLSTYHILHITQMLTMQHLILFSQLLYQVPTTIVTDSIYRKKLNLWEVTLIFKTIFASKWQSLDSNQSLS